MPLRVVSLDPRENAIATQRITHWPLRFTLWVSKDRPDLTSDFRILPCPEQELRRLASATPRLPFLELVLFEDRAHPIAFLGHRDEYSPDIPGRHHPKFRGKLESPSATVSLAGVLRESLIPGTLDRILRSIQEEQCIIRRAREQLRDRDEKNAMSAHLIERLRPQESEDCLRIG